MISELAAIASINDEILFPFVIVLLLPLLLFLLLFAFVALKIFRPWLQGYMSSCPISVFQILGMKFRRVDVPLVVRCAVTAKQADCPVTCKDLERAYLQRVDLEKVTLAYIESRGKSNDWTFADLVDAERSDRLADMLGGR